MKLFSIAVVPALVLGIGSFPAAHAQVAAAAAASAAPHLVAAAPAILTGAVSSGSAHVGQAVLAKLTSGSALSDGTKLPAGSQLLGHLTEVQSLAGGKGKSSLGMVFDHVKAPGGQTQQLGSSLLQSVGSGRKGNGNTAEADAAASASSNSNSNAVGDLLGGVTNTVGTTVGTVGNTVNGLVGTVTSLPGVVLNSTGTLMAQGREVQVPAGTQVSIAASASANAQ